MSTMRRAPSGSHCRGTTAPSRSTSAAARRSASRSLPRPSRGSSVSSATSSGTPPSRMVSRGASWRRAAPRRPSASSPVSVSRTACARLRTGTRASVRWTRVAAAKAVIQLPTVSSAELHPGALNMTSTKRALITGVTGQDGSYLAELLLSKGYEVHGLVRRSSSFNTGRLDDIYQDPHEERQLILHYAELSDGARLVGLLREIAPHEVYHLGAQSHVKVSFDMPDFTGDVTGLGTTRLLEAIRTSRVETRFYQASSSEMFGATPPPQNEQTPFWPRSPYGVAKLYGYWITRNYREAYDMFAVNGILFNHESPRRGETFVTRKISRAVARIVAGQQKHLYLGNLEAVRDWGYAPEYVEGMWRMLQHQE